MKEFFSLERQVGFIIISVFLLVSLSITNQIFFIITISLIFLLAIITLIKPKFLSTLAILWILLGGFLGRIFTPIILFIIYALSIVTTSLILKIINIKLMDLKFDKEKTSYWVFRSAQTSDMKNQF